VTTINCSSNCVYQVDGTCCFEQISTQKVTPNSNCAYYLSTKQTEATLEK